MAHEDDLHVARYAVSRVLLAREQLQEALFEMFDMERSTGGERWPLGVILVSSGYLPEAAMLSLLAERVRPARTQLTSSQAEDIDIGKLLVMTGTLEPDQVNDALAIQQSNWKPGQPSKRLGEIVVDMGAATPVQIQRVLAYQRQACLICDKCTRRFLASRASPRAERRCPRCGGALILSHDLAFDESIKLSETEIRRRRAVAPVPTATAPVGEQAQIDRALAIYVRQKSLVPPEALREAQRVQLEMSQFGIEIALLDLMKRLGAVSPRQAVELAGVDFASIVHGADWSKQTVPGYQITRKIAAGGTATLFAAQQLFGGTTVAVKILHPDRARDASTIAQFRREAELLVKFDHPAIVKGLETGEIPPLKKGAPSLHFLTMEFVDAEALDHLIAGRGAISPRHSVRILAQVAHALMYMEKQGYVHRDVKPENILVDRKYFARLCDLGLASELRAVRGGRSEFTAGTAAYMSPEQAEGASDLDPASDIFSLGLTLYAMLAGHPPFMGETAEEIMERRFGSGRDGTPDIARLPAPPVVQALLKRMMEPDRTLRISSYPELLEALKQA